MARALMGSPELMLMDEPSQGLAPIIVETISGIMVELVAEGFTILLVEQNLEMSMRIGNYFYIMDQGCIVYEADKTEFLANKEVREMYLGV
jgi:branched-chain amino acid transport system ATP-binding protein